MGPVQASTGQSPSFSPRSIPSSRIFSRLAPLIEGGADSAALKEAIASGAAHPESLRKAMFWLFSTMRITDTAKKKALLSGLMECTQSEAERGDLERILRMETAPSENRMFIFAYKGATKVLFEYAARKLISMQGIAGVSAAELDYFEDILMSVVEMASKDRSLLKAARRVLEGISKNGASPETRDLVFDALGKLDVLGMNVSTEPRGKCQSPGR